MQCNLYWWNWLFSEENDIMLYFKFQKQIAKLGAVISMKEKSDGKPGSVKVIEIKRRRHYNDDLRKGYFQFIQACGMYLVDIYFKFLA